MKEMRWNVRSKPGLFWGLEIFYLIFTGYVSFPLRPEPGQIAILLVGIVIMAVILAALLDGGAKGVGTAWGLALSCLAAGVAARYVIERGEAANTAIFTPVDIAVFLLLISLAFAGVYALASVGGGEEAVPKKGGGQKKNGKRKKR